MAKYSKAQEALQDVADYFRFEDADHYLLALMEKNTKGIKAKILEGK